MCLVRLSPFQAEVNLCCCISRNTYKSDNNNQAGTLWKSSRNWKTSTSHWLFLAQIFQQGESLSFLSKPECSPCIVQNWLTLTSVLFFSHNQAFLFVTFLTICLPRTFETFYWLICSILPPNLLVLLLPSPTLFSFEPIWTWLCQPPERLSEKFVWLQLSLWFDSGGESHNTAPECLWNGSEWKGLTERNPTEWTMHAASWLEKLPTGFLFSSSKVRNSAQLGGLRGFFIFKNIMTSWLTYTNCHSKIPYGINQQGNIISWTPKAWWDKYFSEFKRCELLSFL